MKKLKWHKIGNQDIFTTPGISLKLGTLTPTKVEEFYAEDNMVEEIFKNSKRFTIKNNKLVDKNK